MRALVTSVYWVGTLLIILALSGVAPADDIPEIKNPNHHAMMSMIEGKPRDPKTIAAEKELMIQGSRALRDHALEHGVGQAIEELNKGRNGVFGPYVMDYYAYWSCAHYTDRFVASIIGAIEPMHLGFEGDYDIWEDLSGWKYNRDMTSAARAHPEGVLSSSLWSEPRWAGGKKCRQYVYMLIFKIGDDEYHSWRNIWLDE